MHCSVSPEYPTPNQPKHKLKHSQSPKNVHGTVCRHKCAAWETAHRHRRCSASVAPSARSSRAFKWAARGVPDWVSSKESADEAECTGTVARAGAAAAAAPASRDELVSPPEPEPGDRLEEVVEEE